MTDFYKNKMKALRLLEQMLTAGMDKETIVWNISRNFGFSEKFVDTHIDIINKISKKNKE